MALEHGYENLRQEKKRNFSMRFLRSTLGTALRGDTRSDYVQE